MMRDVHRTVRGGETGRLLDAYIPASPTRGGATEVINPV
jgi:hypothetical protein